MEKQQSDQRDLACRRQQHVQRRALDEQAGAHDAGGDRGHERGQADRERQDGAAKANQPIAATAIAATKA